MDAALLTLHQVVLMLLLIAVGAACARLGWFTDAVARALSKFLLGFVTPALLLDAFYQPYDARMARGLLLSAALGVLFHALAALLAQALLRGGAAETRAVARLGAVYSNCGFMAFPLVRAVLGDEGVFYGSAFVAVFNVFLWTHGRALLLGRKGLDVKKALGNPGVLGAAAGALLYFTRLPLPDIASGLIASLASLNTPLAMMVTGVFLARCRPKELLDRRVLYPAALRMCVMPGAFLLLLALTGAARWSASGGAFVLTAALCAGCPSAASSVLMTSSLGLDSAYGARIIFASSVLSVVTVPLLALAASGLA
ncbi:MAG: AEC family transporter [Eubacteriales bacterium]|nr:AEC family transporter [Eubacteriales bacterium]